MTEKTYKARMEKREALLQLTNIQAHATELTFVQIFDSVGPHLYGKFEAKERNILQLILELDLANLRKLFEVIGL